MYQKYISYLELSVEEHYSKDLYLLKIKDISILYHFSPVK